MYKSILAISLLTYILVAEVVVPDNYLLSEEKNISYIYANEYASILDDLKAYQSDIIKGYEKTYGYGFDSRLYVGLASSKNQIANGFSTQFPFNQQIFYGAGAGYIDYFCFSSWLKTLIIHETAHNFQLNPKFNDLSKIGHDILGNTPFAMFSFIPLFPLPNITESSFILEGNAVMNESRYGNGGRLFSGYALAEVVVLARAGLITPELMYNETLNFPYGEKFYLVGGFFQQFLVKKFGIERVNGYFKTYATQPLPFFTNKVFQQQFGATFEVLLAQFVDEVQKVHQGFKTAQGRILAKSQIFVPLNRDAKKVYSVVSDKKSAPKILEIDRENESVKYVEGSWRVGEPFKINGSYYTQSSAKTKPTQITMGLFDKNGYLLKGTEGHVVQGDINGSLVYFDITKSLETPYVYSNGEALFKSYSSVYINKGNAYYFKQEGEKRVLYKNNEASFSYQGHYGFVVDIGKDETIYFIASTPNGSTVYGLKDRVLKQIIDGDDIIEFKLLGQNRALIVTIGADGYTYKVVNFRPSEKASSSIYYNNIANQPTKIQAFQSHQSSRVTQKYRPLEALRKSSLYQSMNYSSYGGFGFDLQMNFSDPLMQNALSVPLSYNRNRTVLGVKYENRAYPLEFGATVYGVYSHDNTFEAERDYGLDGYLRYPFLATGYWRGTATTAYTKAYDNIYRTPLTLSLDISHAQKFGLSKYLNSLNALSLFASRDRDNNTVGLSYQWEKGFSGQTYLGFKGAYFKSDGVDMALEKGIEISDTFSSLQSDSATLNMPSLTTKTYAKEVKTAEITLKKVFDGAFYNFSFPLSLQRESIYLKEKFYDIDFTEASERQYSETTIGLEADFLFIHKLPIPLKFEYIYNADVPDKELFRVLVGADF